MKKLFILMAFLGSLAFNSSFALADDDPVLIEVEGCVRVIKNKLEPNPNVKIFINLRRAHAIIENEKGMIILINSVAHCVVAKDKTVAKVKEFIADYSD